MIDWHAETLQFVATYFFAALDLRPAAAVLRLPPPPVLAAARVALAGTSAAAAARPDEAPPDLEGVLKRIDLARELGSSAAKWLSDTAWLKS